MPKLARNSKQIEDDLIRAEIAAGMNSHGIRRQNCLAQRAGIPQSTLSIHMRDLDRMTLGELRRIAMVVGLKISIERRCGNEH